MSTNRLAVILLMAQHDYISLSGSAPLSSPLSVCVFVSISLSSVLLSPEHPHIYLQLLDICTKKRAEFGVCDHLQRQPIVKPVK